MPTRTSQHQSAKELLSTLRGKKTPVKQQANRPELKLPQSVEASFVRFAEAYDLLKQVEARVDAEREILNDSCFNLWLKTLWKTKRRPPNPSISILKNGKTDIQGLFQVQERYKLNRPSIPEDSSLEEIVIDIFADKFEAIGTSRNTAETIAKNLVDRELKLEDRPIIDLYRLTYGHYEGEYRNRVFVEATPSEQILATKIISLIKARTNKELVAIGCLTDTEEGLALEFLPQMVVNKGFLDRVTSYVTNVEQLKEIFGILVPVRFPRVNKCGLASNAEEQNKRRLEVAKDIMGL